MLVQYMYIQFVLEVPMTPVLIQIAEFDISLNVFVQSFINSPLMQM